MQELPVNVGILSAPEIHFQLNGPYACHGKDREATGKQSVSLEEDRMLWKGKKYEELLFVPKDEQATFSIEDVTIGVHFHWERKETQLFGGSLKLIIEGDRIVAVNTLPVETYLTSVISSEMNATSSVEFLKAHAIISRSWLIAQIEKKNRTEKQELKALSLRQTDETHIRWYDREDHMHYDVCADDHCQRYQGMTKASNPNVVEAVRATRGMVLVSGNEICDARFSKCCGGITEEFSCAWEDRSYPYLSAVYDGKEQCRLPDLTEEREAERWIQSSPEAFCHTNDRKVLSQVLNNYDQETNDFYRWKIRYAQAELSTLIKDKSGIDFGAILDLIPTARGKSGRLWKLKIVGEKKTLVVGKELEIRRILSPTHLFSSAFVVEKEQITDGIPEGFLLIGAGWGHGVGLCQIGAAMMGEQGCTFDRILSHYYKKAEIKRLYE